MYFWSVLKNLFKPNNTGTIIFFLLNVAIIMGIFSAGGTAGIAMVLVLYLISIMVAFSRVGEMFLSFSTGARKMKRLDMQKRIEPIVRRVYQKAKAESPVLSDDIIIKVMYDPTPNAFAVGRRTICVTEGLFELPDEMIEGVLAHEFGHIALHHTDIQLLIGGGNFVVTFFIVTLKLISAIITAITSLAAVTSKSASSGCLFSGTGILSAGVVWLWTKFCMLFLRWSSRANEYAADEYAYKIGFGYELAQVLDRIGTGTPKDSFFRAIYSTHPETNDRIGKLQELGVPYSRY